MIIAFPHRQSAHCETGVASNLFTFHGVPLSEAMAFGIGSGLFFGHIPFLRINGLPLTSYRTTPGSILRRAAKRLGVDLRFRTFRSRDAAMAELDRLLAGGTPVGVQAGVFWLPYFPPALRFHFNAHNLVVLGKEGEVYRISDPVFPEPVSCPAADLARARFAAGAMSPRGKMYYVATPPKRIDPAPAIVEAIREVCFWMDRVPASLIGVRGIRFLAGRMEGWPSRLGPATARRHLGNVIRMQEEIGTGGGGYRFIYAAFLQEAATILGDGRLAVLSAEMTAIGDRWRDFAAEGARICKGRPSEGVDFGTLSRILLECAERERAVYRELGALTRKGRHAGGG